MKYEYKHFAPSENIKRPIGIYTTRDQHDEKINYQKTQILKGLELDYEKRHVKDLGKLMEKIDSLSEELRVKKKILAEIEQERNQLLPFKEKYTVLKLNYDKDKLEIKRLNSECEKIKEELNEITNRKFEHNAAKPILPHMVYQLY